MNGIGVLFPSQCYVFFVHGRTSDLAFGILTLSEAAAAVLL